MKQRKRGVRMQGRMSFRLMAARFKVRDASRPPAKILDEIGVRPGMTVLDLGCGPGSFSVAAVELTGPAGTVYALDINPAAIKSVKRAARRKGLANVVAILGADLRAIPVQSCNVALLHDVLHALPDPRQTMTGVHRLLKHDGVLAVGDHHMTQDEIVSAVTFGGLFSLSGTLPSFPDIYRFGPAKAGVEASQ